MPEYNYSEFVMENEMLPFGDFSSVLNAGSKAPDFALENLHSGVSVDLKSFWSRGFAVIEFGSFT